MVKYSTRDAIGHPWRLGTLFTGDWNHVVWGIDCQTDTFGLECIVVFLRGVLSRFQTCAWQKHNCAVDIKLHKRIYAMHRASFK